MRLALVPVCLGLTFLVGCGQTAPQTCTPGQEIDCECPGGGSGVQKCKGDGSGYEECAGCGVAPDAGAPRPDAGSCQAGAACDAGPCKVGAISCATGAPVCVASGNTADGVACGSGKVCLGGACQTCAAGTACAPANPCHAGTLSCSGGFAVCSDSGANLAAGTPCGAGKVCNGQGSCGACTAGGACVPANDPCHEGTLTCAGDAPTCTATAGKRPAGTSCGPDKVCGADGVCVACKAGVACVSSNPCRTAVTACGTGAQVCTDTGNAQEGATCGANLVCRGGACVSCTAGQKCTPANQCRTGVLDCTTGQCNEDGGWVPDGSSCGTSAVCYRGTCGLCATGQACAPPNPCHAGTTECTTGRSVCADTGNAVAAGTACGAGKVCNAASDCVTCAAGATCAPTNLCKTGAIQCSTGAPVCTEAANKANGTSCGTNLVCSGGVCGACTQGAACTPTNPCHTGTIECATGVPVCKDAGANLANGTTCGTNQVCNAGTCGACTADASCSTGDPCQTGKITCASGLPVCVPSGASSATQCGNLTKGTCTAGVCQCPAGSGYWGSDCQVCPGITNGLQVNADPSKGKDNQCCGRTSTAAAFGGPCLTITQALKNARTSESITVTGDPQGNVSDLEVYPLVLANTLSLTGKACLPGASGKPILKVDGANVSVATYYTSPSIVLGTKCDGTAGGATDAIYVSPAAKLTLGPVTLKSVENGIHIDAGYVELNGAGTVLVEKVSGSGVLCRSDSAASTSTLYVHGDYQKNMTLQIRAAAQQDILASSGCNVTGSYGWGYTQIVLGDSPPCPAVKRDRHGIVAEGNGHATFAGFISCMSGDGLRLQKNAALTTTNPRIDTVSTNSSSGRSTIRNCGCAAGYAETGKLTAGYLVLRNNHYGILQRSDLASSDPASALVSLTNASLGCNTGAEPGTCCASGDCPPGASIYNNSGLPLSAAGNAWNASPLAICNCPANLTGCTCSTGATVPPDGVDVLNAPLATGTPTTDVSNYTQLTTPLNCAQ